MIARGAAHSYFTTFPFFGVGCCDISDTIFLQHTNVFSIANTLPATPVSLPPLYLSEARIPAVYFLRVFLVALLLPACVVATFFPWGPLCCLRAFVLLLYYWCCLYFYFYYCCYRAAYLPAVQIVVTVFLCCLLHESGVLRYSVFAHPFVLQSRCVALSLLVIVPYVLLFAAFVASHFLLFVVAVEFERSCALFPILPVSVFFCDWLYGSRGS